MIVLKAHSCRDHSLRFSSTNDCTSRCARAHHFCTTWIYRSPQFLPKRSSAAVMSCDVVKLEEVKLGPEISQEVVPVEPEHSKGCSCCGANEARLKGWGWVGLVTTSRGALQCQWFNELRLRFRCLNMFMRLSTLGWLTCCPCNYCDKTRNKRPFLGCMYVYKIIFAAWFTICLEIETI